MKRLILIRGASGSGKSSLAGLIKGLFVHTVTLTCEVFETDDYFWDSFSGTYRFDPSRLPAAHGWNQERVKEAMKYDQTNLIIVSNTFTKNWEMEPYIALARIHGYDLTVVRVESGLAAPGLAARNEHGLDERMIQKQLDRFEDFSLKDFSETQSVKGF